MAKKLVFLNDRYREWSRKGETSLSGNVILEDQSLSLEQIDRRFLSTITLDDIAETMRNFNGHYALIHNEDKGTFAAVDRVRSIPLFYGFAEKDVYISDDANWIYEKIPSKKVDDLSKNEFLFTGYVTDNKTLIPSIFQIRPGEIVNIFLNQHGQWSIECRLYQPYSPRAMLKKTTGEIMVCLDQILVNVFSRMIRIADGRSIVIPLSGGYDSRLIALMLKRLEYPNIITFSYGCKDSKEASISKSLAKALEWRWEFIEYTNEKWYSWYRSDDWFKYSIMAGGLSSTPHIQDWPALKMLKERGLIPEDSIIVPGHTVASPSEHVHYDEEFFVNHIQMPGYDYLPIENFHKGGVHIEQIIDDILLDHYNLNGIPIEDSFLLRSMKKNIALSLGEVSSYEDDVSAYESWDLKERQSKFIVNSIRVYDYWGYSWWIPLLDKEFMDFWSRVPIELRLQKRLIKTYVDQLSNSILTNIDFYPESPKGKLPGISKIQQEILKRERVLSYAKKTLLLRNKVTQYGKHPLAYYGIMSKRDYWRKFSGRENINFYIASDYLDRLMDSARDMNNYLPNH